ncbi:MAG: recombinase family protein [Oscillospiraceae bacterium]|nr:recombinase family protein [Oscillospiraceae bacterium]
MATVTMIPAKTKVGARAKSEEAPKLRVAAYCRVSTDTDEQATSYDAQIEHYTDYIGKHPGWELAGIYADDGISGTNTKKREEFNRLIDDCMAGRVDMVVTKSISRFARNTLDCLKYIRQLKDKNIAVFFEKEAINTLDAKGEVLLTIMASLAQQESQSLSQNVRLGLQYRYQQGKVQVCANRFLGYDKDEEGNLVINPAEAEVVKRIFREYLSGKSYYQIGKELTDDGIRTAAGSDYWLASTLKKILTNEKYIGDALLQKTVTTDFLNKKRVINKGIVPQYYVEGSHEAIIPRELFMQVQEEMVRRANLETGTGKRRTYSGKYPSSTTLLVLSVMPTLKYQIDRRIANPATRTAITVFVIVFSAFMVIGRLIAGVHWITDIIGSVFLSSGLFMIYRFMAEYTDQKKTHLKAEVSNGVQ